MNGQEQGMGTPASADTIKVEPYTPLTDEQVRSFFNQGNPAIKDLVSWLLESRIRHILPLDLSKRAPIDRIETKNGIVADLNKVACTGAKACADHPDWGRSAQVTEALYLGARRGFLEAWVEKRRRDEYADKQVDGLLEKRYKDLGLLGVYNGAKDLVESMGARAKGGGLPIVGGEFDASQLVTGTLIKNGESGATALLKNFKAGEQPESLLVPGKAMPRFRVRLDRGLAL